MWGVEGQFWTQDADGNVDWYFGIDGKDKLGNEVSDMQIYRFFYNIPIENSVRALSDNFSSRLYQKSIEIYTDVEVYPDLFLGLTSEEYVSNHSNLDTFGKESGIKFIIGEAVRTSLLDAYNALNGTACTFA